MLVSAPVVPAPSFASLQPIFQTDEALDANKVAHFICRLLGITGCVIASKKDLIQSGAVPFDFDLDAFRTTFPAFTQLTGDHAGRLNIGPVHDFTLNCERFAVSFFPQGEACLCVFQNDRNLHPDVREKLLRVIEELARII